jgi:hypothetical protein
MVFRISILRGLPPVLTVISPVFAAQSSPYVSESGIEFNGYTDPNHGITFGFIFPPANTSGVLGREFIGEIVAPIKNKWVNNFFPIVRFETYSSSSGRPRARRADGWQPPASCLARWCQDCQLSAFCDVSTFPPAVTSF